MSLFFLSTDGADDTQIVAAGQRRRKFREIIFSRLAQALKKPPGLRAALGKGVAGLNSERG
ncbi:MAG: hypothetical protein WBN32_00340 [Woeseia sp.]